MDAIGAMRSYSISQGNKPDDGPMTSSEFKKMKEDNPDTPEARKSRRELEKLTYDERKKLMDERRRKKRQKNGN